MNYINVAIGLLEEGDPGREVECRLKPDHWLLHKVIVILLEGLHHFYPVIPLVLRAQIS